MTWVKPLLYALVFYGALLLSHTMVYQMGKAAARGELAQLYIRLNEAARTDGAIVQLLDDWERDLKSCHQRLARYAVQRR